MNRFKFALAVIVAAGFAPTVAYSEELDEEKTEIVEEYSSVQEEGEDELKALIGAMKSDRSANRDRVKRIKQLIRDKGWHKNREMSQDTEEEPESEAT